MSAAGPIVGLVSSYLALRLSSAYQEKRKGSTYTEAWRASAQKPLINKEQNLGLQTAALVGGVMNIASLMPIFGWNRVSDGYHILAALGGSHLIGKQSLMIGVLTSLMLLGYGGYSLYKMHTVPDEPIPEP